MILKLKIILSVICLYGGNVFAQEKLDSAKYIIYNTSKSNPNYIQTCFFIADEYMSNYQYDSAQGWLNLIHEQLTTRTNSISNYYLMSRQAEVYYYNNLLQLGFQESRQSLEMAKKLNDSLLIADSYNFLGLFSLSLDSISNSITYFSNGLRYIKDPPYPKGYLELSLPHHIYGNLAEAYQKKKMYDSSLYFIKESLFAAEKINQKRGTALAYIGIADIFLEMGKIDSAKSNYLKANKLAKLYTFLDLKLLCIGGNAKCQSATKNFKSMEIDLEKGIELLKSQPIINRYYRTYFLNNAIQLLKEIDSKNNLISALELKSKLDKEIINEGNGQLSFIVEAGLINEKRLNNLQIQEAQRNQELANTRIILAIILIIILLITFFVYRHYQKQVLTISRVRNIISQDLHDEIGASISSLQIYGTVAEQLLVSNPSKAMEMIKKIKNQSRDIMETMSDIVWSMKSNEEDDITLETKIKNYAASILQESNINFSFKIQAEAELMLCNVKARRNILLIIRELMNNALKYSNATQFTLTLYTKEENWIMEISDNGVGIEIDYLKNKGNGLNNIKKRCSELNGTYLQESVQGTKFIFIFPIQIISNIGW